MVFLWLVALMDPSCGAVCDGVPEESLAVPGGGAGGGAFIVIQMISTTAISTNPIIA